jgi:hypothetical protein
VDFTHHTSILYTLATEMFLQRHCTSPIQIVLAVLFTVNRTMPRALLVSEILSNIISYLNVKFDQRATHQWQGSYAIPSGLTLFTLALTCRAFSEQALDALWDTLIGFEPLTRIIPARGKGLQDKDYPIVSSFFF